MMMGFDLILIALVGGIAYAFGWRPNVNLNGIAQSKQTPLEVLKNRYASGQITRDEYEQARQDLEA